MQKSLTIILLLIFNLTIGQKKVDPTESLISELKTELNGKNITDFFVVKQITYGTAYIFDLDDPNSCNPNGIYFTIYAFWKDGKDEFFFTTEVDAVNYSEKFKKYGYTAEVKPIYFQEVGVN